MQTLRFRKPEPIPLLFIIAATCLLVGLGAWQLERLKWKSALLTDIEAAQQQPALGGLPADVSDTALLEFRNAVLTGTYLADKKLRFIGRQANGYVWYVPLKLEDSDLVVLAELPWLPAGSEPKLGHGPQTVKGILRPARAPRLFSPANRPDQDLWFTEDFKALEKATGLMLVPLILDTDGKPNLRNDHLGYAVTWFLLAGVGLVMFLIYHRKTA